MAVSLGLTGVAFIKTSGGFASRNEAQPHKNLALISVSHRLTAGCGGKATEREPFAGQ